MFTYKIKPIQNYVIVGFFKFCLVILSVKVIQKNRKDLLGQPAMLVSNHCSYLDIPVFGATKLVRFTPKAEIKKWPFLGMLVSFSLPVYITRSAKYAKQQKQQLQDVLTSGDSILIYPEGTTSDGSKVLPFKSSLFSAIEAIPETLVQPVAVVYKSMNGKKLNNQTIKKIAWFGDMTFMPHFWELLLQKNIIAEIYYHAPLKLSDFTSRKELAAEAQKIVSETFYSKTKYE